MNEPNELKKNPIIGDEQIETLENIHDVLALLQQIPLTSDDHKLCLNESQTWGLIHTIECLLKALRFELSSKQKDKP